MTTTQRGATAPSATLAPVQPDEAAALDRAVDEVARNANAWAMTAPAERAELLERLIADTFAVSESWNNAACAAKGLDPNSSAGGEEIFSGIGTFLRMARAFASSMRDIAKDGRPHFPGPVTHKPDGRIAVGVLPASTFEKVLYGGIRAEVWMEPGVTIDDVTRTQASAYQTPAAHAGVSLVLGAGNVASLGPRDVLSKLFAEGKVVVLKANPVNEYLVPYWSSAMAVLIERGFLRIVSGGAGVGAYLTSHPRIDDIHVTGSDKTHDAIVFGTGDEGAQRKAANQPVIVRPVSCELGNVSPVVIVPGEWSEKEIRYQARHVATMLINNAGFNCLTPRVLITQKGWAQSDEFFAELGRVFASVPTRRAYYPGAKDRYQRFLDEHPDAEQIGEAADDALPWTMIRDVDPNKIDDVAFNVEAFCSLLATTQLEATSTADFVRRAVDFCNDVVWGTLSMTLIADPRTLRDPEAGPAIEQAVADLRYGSIGVNLWHAMSFAFATTVWGAYPGHVVTDIQSGTGFVGNAYLFASPQKSVVRGPFVTSPEPAWFATNPNGGAVMRKLLAFEAKPSWLKIPGLLVSALRK